MLECGRIDLRGIISAVFNFIKQGYEYLKTLDEYKDAVDC